MWIYILHFTDNTHYTGITHDVIRRVKQHTSAAGITSRSYVGRKIRKWGMPVVAFVIEVNEASKELYYKAHAKRFCQVCTIQTTVNENNTPEANAYTIPI